MKPLHRSLQLLFFLEVLLLIAGFLISRTSAGNLVFKETALLSAVFAVSSAITLIIFFRGQGKEPASQTLHSLVSVTLKFLIDLILAFVWFFIAKKTGLYSVVSFFILYLTFTLFSILFMVKTLKNKPL